MTPIREILKGVVPCGECTCSMPIPHPSPYRHSCAACGYAIAHRWESNDKNLAEFLDAVETGFPSWPSVPESWSILRLQCEARERAGRKTFGFQYLKRDNIKEAKEEIADGLLYLYLQGLAEERKGETHETDVLLTIAHHLAEAYAGLDQLRAKHRGAP